MTDLQKTRERLEARLAALEARAAELEHEIREPLSRDLEEQAAELETEDALGSLEDTALDEIRAIRAALGRMANGTYGTCVTCGEPIDAGRLAALPEAAQCVGCAAG